jgi:PEP-CTERM motif
MKFKRAHLVMNSRRMYSLIEQGIRMRRFLSRLSFGRRIFVLSLALVVGFVLAGPIQASILVPAPGVFLPPDVFTTCAGCTVLASGTFPSTLDSFGNWEASGTVAVVNDPNAIGGVRAGAGLDFMYQFANVPKTGTDDSIGRLTAIDFTGFATDVGYNIALNGVGIWAVGTGTPGSVDRQSADDIGFNFSVPFSVPMTPGTTSVVLEIATNATAPNWTTGKIALIDGGSLNEDAFQPGPPVPEPATMLLFGSGLVGLAGLRRRLGR